MFGRNSLPCGSVLVAILSTALAYSSLPAKDEARAQVKMQGQRPASAPERVELDDAVGDANTQGGRRPDLVRLILESDGNVLRLELVFDQDLEPILRQRHETIGLGEVYLDCDDDTSTGVDDDNFGGSTGFEYRSTIATGFRLEDGTHLWGTASTKPSGRRVVAYYVGDTLKRYSAPSVGEEVREPSGGRGSYTGKIATVTFGYEDLGVAPGDVVRVKFYKLGTKKVLKDAYLPEVRVRLR